MDSYAPECWDLEAGVDALQELYDARKLVLRATQNALQKFSRKYFKGNEKVLEVGSGLGFLSENWPKEFQGEWVKSRTARRFFAEGSKPGTKICGSVYNLPFQDQSFDVVCGYCSYDVLNNLESAVTESLRVLKKGGLFFHLMDVSVDPLPVRDDLIKKRIPCYLGGKANGFTIFGNSALSQLRYLPEGKLELFLQAVGMSKEEMGSIDPLDFSFALDYFAKKNGSDPEQDSEVHLFEYTLLFGKYALIQDTNTYFDKRIIAALAGTQVKTEKVVGKYKGSRTNNHAEGIITVDSDVGITRFNKLWFFKKGIISTPRIALMDRRMLPEDVPVYEKSTLRYVVARKM